MDDAQAAMATGNARREEVDEGQPRLVAVHAVKVEFALHNPAATAQIPEQGAWQATAQKSQFIAALHQCFEGRG